jgi:hypothetical protein
MTEDPSIDVVVPGEDSDLREELERARQGRTDAGLTDEVTADSGDRPQDGHS